MNLGLTPTCETLDDLCEQLSSGWSGTRLFNASLLALPPPMSAPPPGTRSGGYVWRVRMQTAPFILFQAFVTYFFLPSSWHFSFLADDTPRPSDLTNVLWLYGSPSAPFILGTLCKASLVNTKQPRAHGRIRVPVFQSLLQKHCWGRMGMGVGLRPYCLRTHTHLDIHTCSTGPASTPTQQCRTQCSQLRCPLHGCIHHVCFSRLSILREKYYFGSQQQRLRSVKSLACSHLAPNSLSWLNLNLKSGSEKWSGFSKMCSQLSGVG